MEYSAEMSCFYSTMLKILFILIVIKEKHSADREFQYLAASGKKLLTLASL